MKKLFLLVLFTLLFSSDLVFSQVDTVWVSNLMCSMDNITVSPDERFVVAWGSEGWRFDPDYPNGSNLYGDPAKVFNAQTGEWLITIFDSTSGLGSFKRNVNGVSFSPDSKYLLVGIDTNTNVYDLNDNFRIIATIPDGGIAHYSPDMSVISIGFNFYEAATYKLLKKFDSKIKTGIEPEPTTFEWSSGYGVFRKNGREFVRTYLWRAYPPLDWFGSGQVVIDLVDSTKTQLVDGLNVNLHCDMRHRYGTNLYSCLIAAKKPYYTYALKDQLTDEIVWQKTIYNNYFPVSRFLPQVSKDGKYVEFGRKYYSIHDTVPICSFVESNLNPVLGNTLIFDITNYEEHRIMAVRACNFNGVNEEKGAEDIKVYPTPTDNKLNIQINLLGGDYKAEIVDILGRRLTVLSLGYLPNGQQTIYLEVEELPSGIYQAILRSQSEVRAVKFVKE